ncbi:MAG: aspartyl protease family protein [Bacteroidota bacterium]
MIIKARINGKAVSLLVDTGAPNVISSSLVEKLNLISINSEEVSDIHGTSERLEIVRLDTVTVGNTNFLNTTATVANFNELPFSCLEIDGLLGSNLMRHAIWDFDFQTQTISFSSSPPRLDSKDDVYTSKIFVGAAGVPAVTLNSDGSKVLNNTIDLGSNGGVNMSLKEYLKQKKKGQLDSVIKYIGSDAYGIFGIGDSISTSYHSIINEFTLGDLEIRSQPVSFEGDGNRIGLEFWTNYRLILNWFDREVKLISANNPKKADDEISFTPVWSENNLFITQIKLGTNAEKDGLQIGDKIISIGSKDLSFLSQEEWCNIVIGEHSLIDAETEIMKVETNSGEIKSIRVR